MEVRRAQVGTHRDYAGSVEDINGLPPAADQLVTGSEFTDVVDTLDAYGDWLDRILADASLRWVAGFDGLRTWVIGEQGAPVAYHSTTGSTTAQRAATVPGTNSLVWTATDGNTDFLATYSAAKA